MNLSVLFGAMLVFTLYLSASAKQEVFPKVPAGMGGKKPMDKSILTALTCTAGSSWIKVRSNVCFEAKDNKPGWFSFRYGFSSNGIIEVKLVHLTGKVQCSSSSNDAAFWGCARAGVKNYPFNVFITDVYNKVIFPKSHLINYNRGGWYYSLPGFGHSSSEIVFTDHGSPVKFPPGLVHLRIWYGEDLLNWYEGNNSGKVCVDVYFVLASV